MSGFKSTATTKMANRSIRTREQLQAHLARAVPVLTEESLATFAKGAAKKNAEKIVWESYNHFYGEKGTLKKLSSPRGVRTVVYGNPPGITFFADEKNRGLKEFFNADKEVLRGVIELGRFAQHPKMWEYDSDFRLGILSQMFDFVQMEYPDKKLALIMAPNVLNYVARTDWNPIPLGWSEKHTRASSRVRMEWPKYWGERPEAYLLVKRRNG